jgi:uncharacterized protein (TIGR02117 family)
MRREIRTGLRWAARALAALLAIFAAYLLAGHIGGAIPSNRDWAPPREGVTIYVETNGIHTGVTVPTVAAGIDWRRLVRAEHLRDPRYAGGWLAFGWGERAFYLETPTWADLDISTVAKSAIGSDRTLVHVDHIARVRPGEDARPVVLTPEQYRQLVDHILRTFALRDGAAVPVGSYGVADVFYEARGHYDALQTCNSWTGDALRAAGVRVGAWTPFPWTVMWWFDAPQ